MKISLLSYGTYGDVLPYISLARALQQRGHEVVLAASENFRDAVERAGITYASLRGDTREILSGDEPRRAMATGNALQWMNEIRKRMDAIRPQLIDDARDASADVEVIVASSLMSFLAEACASVHRTRACRRARGRAAGGLFGLGRSAILGPDAGADWRCRPRAAGEADQRDAARGGDVRGWGSFAGASGGSRRACPRRRRRGTRGRGDRG